MIHDLSKTNSVLNQFVLELRDINIQQDRQRFKRNLERIGEICAYEMSKTFEYQTVEVTTPLGCCQTSKLKEQPVIAAILRAGLPLAQGLNNFFDLSDCAYISAYRKHDQAGGFSIQLEYVACPNLNDRILVIADPMLASGASIVMILGALLKSWSPKEIHIISAIAAQPGINFVSERYPDIHIWTAAIDPELNEKKYIIPGLGDAGDLAFGTKEQC